MSGSRDSAVGIATGYGLDDRGVGVRVLVGPKGFLLSMSYRPALWPTQPLIQWVTGKKRPGCEADHSPPTSAEVKNTRIYIYLLPHTSS
jgi:hypothetical protein